MDNCYNRKGQPLLLAGLSGLREARQEGTRAQCAGPADDDQEEITSIFQSAARLLETGTQTGF